MRPELGIQFLFALSRIPGVGRASLVRLNAALQTGVAWVSIRSNPGRFLKGGMAATASQQIRDDFDRWLAESSQLLQRYANEKISVISILDEEYPVRLRELKDAPFFVFAKGDPALLNRKVGVAVVGSSRCTRHGARVAGELAELLAGHGFNVVSGLAAGIDRAAHEGALHAQGSTTAVCVDVAEMYPKEHSGLANDIVAAGGCLIAENPPGTSPIAGLLVARDRMQSCLSVAVFVVETALKGGTMHTVRSARAQGRSIYCQDPTYLAGASKPEFVAGARSLIETGCTLFSMSDLPRVLHELESKRVDL